MNVATLSVACGLFGDRVVKFKSGAKQTENIHHKTERKGERKKERERVCVCACVCVRVHARVRTCLPKSQVLRCHSIV